MAEEVDDQNCAVLPFRQAMRELFGLPSRVVLYSKLKSTSSDECGETVREGPLPFFLHKSCLHNARILVGFAVGVCLCHAARTQGRRIL